MLNKGWTWISLFVEGPALGNLNMLTSQLRLENQDLIKNQHQGPSYGHGLTDLRKRGIRFMGGIYGGDLRMEFREVFSVMAGLDTEKYHGGLLMKFDAFGFGYTYGENFSGLLNNIPSHQLSVIANFVGMDLWGW